MSAWLISNQTISRIAKALPREDNNESMEALAKALYDMNVEALKARYQEGMKNIITPFQFDKATFPNILQCYQSIKCFLYQCSEGKVPESNLFKRVEEYRRVVAESIADEATEKGGAVWE